mmetsp:Transcript_33021/g.78009  ORF Transcript_33021/g.78009 Transcript_33021/m.78009 type:complete len:99 (+) Transcript_33021:149-445(+)
MAWSFIDQKGRKHLIGFDIEYNLRVRGLEAAIKRNQRNVLWSDFYHYLLKPELQALMEDEFICKESMAPFNFRFPVLTIVPKLLLPCIIGLRCWFIML